MEGRSAGELAAVDDEHVATARDRQVIRDAATGDAAADDDDTSRVDGRRLASRR
jgi:hypothetical protein